jgi:hypothetical protein
LHYFVFVLGLDLSLRSCCAGRAREPWLNVSACCIALIPLYHSVCKACDRRRARNTGVSHSCVGSTQLSRPTLWTTERLRKKLPLRGSQFDNSLLLFCSWWFILLLLISRTQDLYSWTSRQTVNLVTNSPVFSLMCSLFWSCMKSLLLTVVCFSDWQWWSSCCLVCRKVYDVGYVRNPIRN